MKSAVLAVVACLALIGCQKSQPAPTSPVGKYIGKVEFRASAGTRTYENLLLLDENGEFVWTFTEMPLLSEFGTWTESNGVVTLTPASIRKDVEDDKPRVLDLTRALQSAKEPHDVQISSDWMTVTINDGPLSGTLKRLFE
jgi:hypothetical protein